MAPQPRWHLESWIPIVAGLAWLSQAGSGGALGLLATAIPGCLLLASGVSTLLYPGDLRIPQYAALGGILGVLFAIPVLFGSGFGAWLLLTGLSAASFVASGRIALLQEIHYEGIPLPAPSLRLSSEVAVDEALLATMGLSQVMTPPAELPRVKRDVHQARELFRDRGWLEKPADYHQAPPPLEKPRIRLRRTRGLDFEHVSFESGYEPRAEEPGRARWLALSANQRAHAWVLRHQDASRPWLVCIHGYQMGSPPIDLAAFEAEKLHRRLGLNLLLPVLPLHGPRKIGRRSGDHFLSGDPIDTLHAMAQAMWDARRLLGWVRAQGGARVGIHGLSLGGYHTALLACLDDDLATAIPGIPLADVSRTVWRHGPSLQIRYFERQGVVHDELAEVLRVVSPLTLRPKVAKERRHIFGATGDRLVTPDHVRDLWRHWEEPEIVWYPGGHVTFRLHPAVRELMGRALRNDLLEEPARA